MKVDKGVMILDATVEGGSPYDVFDKYAAWTDNVAQYPVTAEPFYLALGIADEIGELNRSINREETLKEAGDSLWYCARYAVRVLKVPFSEIVEEAASISCPSLDFSTHAGIICGVEKKRIRDGEGWSADKRIAKEAEAYTALINLVARIRFMLYMERLSLEDAVRANVDKLGARLDAGTIKGDGDNR